MAITYNAGTNTITVTGAANTFAGIYAADVAGGWGVVTNTQNQYFIAANLVIGDGINAADLTDSNVQVEIGTTGAQKYIQATAASTFQLGSLSNGTYNTQYGAKANSLTLNHPNSTQSYGTWNLYGCSVCVNTNVYYPQLDGAVDFRNCSFAGAGCIWFYLATGTVSRCVFTGVNYGFLCYTSGIAISDVVIQSPTYGMVLGLTVPLRASGVTIDTNTTTDINIGNDAGIAPSMDLIDCSYDRDNVYTYNGDLASVRDFMGLDITVEDEVGNPLEDVTITMVDNQNNSLFAGYDVNLIGHWKLYGDGEDETGNYDFTTISTPVAGTNRWTQPSRAMTFDGNDYMETTSTNILPTGDWSIAFWAKVTAGAAYTILALYKNGAPYTGIRIGNAGANNYLYLWTHNGAAGADTAVCAGFADGTWHHMAITQVQATKVTWVWLDGRYSATYTATGAYAAPDPASKLRLGREFAADRYLNGSISELMIWSGRILSYREVSQLYGYQQPWFQTDVNGEASANMQNYMMYNTGASDGKGVANNTFNDYTPYSYIVEKDGYQTVRGDLDLTEPRELKICLRRNPIAGQGMIS